MITRWRVGGKGRKGTAEGTCDDAQRGMTLMCMALMHGSGSGPLVGLRWVRRVWNGRASHYALMLRGVPTHLSRTPTYYLFAVCVALNVYFFLLCLSSLFPYFFDHLFFEPMTFRLITYWSDPSLLLFVSWRATYKLLGPFHTYPTYFATYFVAYLRQIDLA